MADPDIRREHVVSIHALREEGDLQPYCFACRESVSIHALREEGDTPKQFEFLCGKMFQSTPSARRATPCACI